jgi:hypothetical protein
VSARRAVIDTMLAASTSSVVRASQLDVGAGRSPGYAADLVRSVASQTLAAVCPVLAADLAAARQVLVVAGAKPVLEAAFAEAGVASPRYISQP